MWGMRRIQFYLLKLGRHLNQKEYVFVCISAPFVYLKMFNREWEGAFSNEGTNYNPFPLLPPLAWHSNSTSIITSSYISPCLLVWCFFFSFHLLITLCTQPTQIKEQLQSRSRKLELKGVLSLSTSPSLSPHFSTLLFKQLRRAEVLSEAVSAWAGAVPSSPFPFCFILLRQFSAECQGQVSLAKTTGLPKHGEGLCPSRGLIRSGTLSRWVSKATEKRSTFHPLLVFVMLPTHTIAVYCANR